MLTISGGGGRGEKKERLSPFPLLEEEKKRGKRPSTGRKRKKTPIAQPLLSHNEMMRIEGFTIIFPSSGKGEWDPRISNSPVQKGSLRGKGRGGGGPLPAKREGGKKGNSLQLSKNDKGVV